MAENRFTEEWLARQLQSVKPRITVVHPAEPTVEFKSQRPRKHRNIPTLITFAELELVNGHHRICHTFDSAKEAAHYQALALRRQAGEITNLRLQEPFGLIARVQADGSAKPCGEYYADFVFEEAGQRVVQDVKSTHTRTIAEYRLKKKIVEACWGITILEV